MRASEGRGALIAAAAIVLAIGGLWVAWSPPGANDLRAGDEGYYGTQARNILADPRQLVSPSLTPLGPPGDKPPLYATVIAVAVAALGPTDAAVRWPSYLGSLLVALALAGWLRSLREPWLVWLAPALLLALPWYADSARIATPDIPLTLAGVAALAVLAGGPLSPRRAAVAGACLGLAFQFKLWLAGLFVLPAWIFCVLSPRPRGKSFLVLTTVAAVVSSLQLAAVAVLRPGDLGHWWMIYWQRFVVDRVAGAGDVKVAIQPPGYYAGMLAHALVLVLPLVALGAEACWRRRREALPGALLAWFGGVIVLSAFAVKSGVYLFAVMPAAAALAAMGARALALGARPGGLVALFALASLPLLAARSGGPVAPLGVWLATWTAFGAVVAGSAWRPAWAPRLALGLALLGVGGGLAREAQRLPLLFHRTGYREIASALEPQFAGLPPAQRAFVAPEAPTLAYHWFRSGDYWGTPIRPWSAERFAALERDTSVRVFIVDPSRELYGGWPDSTTLAWLESTKREVSAEMRERTGVPSSLRVFVRP